MRLLVLGCSKRKHPTPTPLPAIQRYDGPAFRITRKYLAKHHAPMLDIIIVSAKYGLIHSENPILDYDQRMTRQRAQELNEEINATIQVFLKRTSYTSVFFHLGNTYRRTVDSTTLDYISGSVAWASGSIGARSGQLKRWLWQNADIVNERQDPNPSPTLTQLPSSPVKLHGVEISFSPEVVLQCARNALASASDSNGVDRFVNWYVLIDERRVAPKWLVSILTGLKVSTFTTDEARRVLRQLGIQTHPVYTVSEHY